MASKSTQFTASMVRALLREVEAARTGKTQTRRLLSVPPDMSVFKRYHEKGRQKVLFSQPERIDGAEAVVTLKYAVGDQIVVREHWRVGSKYDGTAPRDLSVRGMTVAFEAGGSISNEPTIKRAGAPFIWAPSPHPSAVGHWGWLGKFRQAMHMPKWASRLTLEVTGVRVERLQDITDADVLAEGIRYENELDPCGPCHWRCEVQANTGHSSAQAAYRELWDSLNADRAPWASNPWVVVYTFKPMLGNYEVLNNG